MRRLLIAALVCGGLAAPTVASAQPRGDWNWRLRNTNTFRNLGQCRAALVTERRLARTDARRYGWNDMRFNQGWRMRCEPVRFRGRIVYRIR